jgi:chromosome segregation ATPase
VHVQHLNLIQEYWEEVLDDNTPTQHLRNPTPPSQASPKEPERQAATIKSEDCSLGFIDTERVQQPAAAHVRPESGAGSSRKRTSKLAEQIIGIEEERDEMKKQLENERTACADLRRQLEEAKSAALALKSERDALKGELHATNAELKEQRRTTDVNLEASVREATMLRNENVALQLRCGEAEAAVRKIEAQQQEINALTRRIQRATEGLAPSNLPNQSDDDDSVNRQD